MRAAPSMTLLLDLGQTVLRTGLRPPGPGYRVCVSLGPVRAGVAQGPAGTSAGSRPSCSRDTSHRPWEPARCLSEEGAVGQGLPLRPEKLALWPGTLRSRQAPRGGSRGTSCSPKLARGLVFPPPLPASGSAIFTDFELLTNLQRSFVFLKTKPYHPHVCLSTTWFAFQLYKEEPGLCAASWTVLSSLPELRSTRWGGMLSPPRPTCPGPRAPLRMALELLQVLAWTRVQASWFTRAGFSVERLGRR